MDIQNCIRKIPRSVAPEMEVPEKLNCFLLGRPTYNVHSDFPSRGIYPYFNTLLISSSFFDVKNDSIIPNSDEPRGKSQENYNYKNRFRIAFIDIYKSSIWG